MNHYVSKFIYVYVRLYLKKQQIHFLIAKYAIKIILLYYEFLVICLTYKDLKVFLKHFNIRTNFLCGIYIDGYILRKLFCQALSLLHPTA